MLEEHVQSHCHAGELQCATAGTETGLIADAGCWNGLWTAWDWKSDWTEDCRTVRKTAQSNMWQRTGLDTGLLHDWITSENHNKQNAAVEHCSKPLQHTAHHFMKPLRNVTTANLFATPMYQTTTPMYQSTSEVQCAKAQHHCLLHLTK